MHKKPVVFTMFMLAAIGFTVGPVQAGKNKKMTASEILELVDENLTKVEDTTYEAEVSVIRSGKTVKTMKFEARLKGLFMKKITFTAPGDLAGTSIVTTKDSVTYVYMPSYKKVRRVASHVNNQGFMGTDVSGEELGTAALSKGWKATIQKETETHWVLKLVPEPETETAYSSMTVTVSKQYGGVEKIESYNKDGKKVKTQVRSEWETYKDKNGNAAITVPTLFVYTDHLTGSKTRMKFLSCKINQSIPDSIFTKRSLMRGN
ncbi:MAG: outer membrane lipoprotein-sorting protein [Deltaproteobacteria bacterium]|nr:outer membrane lipoprotein-sorting protein [Deltaproteobacteria bacterium]MBN2674593.1 outer membrane lipoprotein-sorting protein [Deltaproteobacteria bacterium]